MRLFLVAIILILPGSSEAAVTISEVAWMGSAASANHEWIELYNDGSAVDVSGWSLTDGMNLNISLTGTIPAQSYAVLERTSEDSAAGSAFLIYTGAMVNGGATLQIKRGDGGLEDQVAGGTDWQNIGGDNLTKETAQYTTAGWVTGTPTPGTSNSGTPADDDEDPTDDDDDTPNTPPTLKVGTGEAVQLVLPGATLKLIVSAQKLGYVNQAIDFKATPSGVGKTFIDSLQYEWNFGDGMTALAKEPTHSYKFPGTYVVTVYGGYKRQEQVARHEITILPVALSLTTSSRGDLQVNNDSPYEIDISGYTINGGKEFIFPKRSIMLPNQTVTLSRNQIGNPVNTEIHDASGVRLLTTHVQKPDTPTKATEPEKIIAPEPIVVSNKKVNEKTSAWHAPLLLPETGDTLKSVLAQYLKPALAEAALTPSSTSTDKNPRVPDAAGPYLALVGVILLGLFGTAHKLTRNQNE